MKKLFILLMCLMVSSVSYAVVSPEVATGDPEFLKIKVYKMAVSTSEFCDSSSTFTTVFEDSDPEYQDVLNDPTFGAGTLADGSYNCVVIEFSDHIRYLPDVNVDLESENGVCSVTGPVGADYYESDVCNVHSEEDPADPFRLIDGTTGSCDDTEQRVAMWLSITGPEDDEEAEEHANIFVPQTSASDNTRGGNIEGAFVVDGDTSAVFVVDGNGKIQARKFEGEESECEMGKPLFIFEPAE